MAMNATTCGVRKARQDSHVLFDWLERLETLGELIVFAGTQWKPEPVLVVFFLWQRHGHAIGKVKTSQPSNRLLALLLLRRRPGKRWEQGKSQGNATTTQESTSIQLFENHFHYPVV